MVEEANEEVEEEENWEEEGWRRIRRRSAYVL